MIRSTKQRLSVLFAVIGLSACGQEAAPRTVEDFEQNPSALDMKLVVCQQDRRTAVKDVECKNARTAAGIIARKEELEREKQLRRRSEQQLDALRRDREALDSAAREQRRILIERAEAKIALGQALTSSEALALGLDPENSVLSEGADELPALPVPRAQEPTAAQPPTPSSEPATPAPSSAADSPESLAEIRKALKDKSNDD
ncbi:MAG: EexN family lipoprotein [Pseudomonadota bacterium]